MQITFNDVRGYKTYANAKKRGEEVETIAARWSGLKRHQIRWMVIAKEDGRFVPAFNVTNFPGGPCMFLSFTNVCTFN